MKTMSTTPRTDALPRRGPWNNYVVDDVISHAHQLETELAEANAMLDWLSHECFLPNDHPEDGLFVVVSEKFAPIGSFTCNAENDKAVFRQAIRQAIRNAMKAL